MCGDVVVYVWYTTHTLPLHIYHTPTILHIPHNLRYVVYFVWYCTGTVVPQLVMYYSGMLVMLYKVLVCVV